MLQITLDMRLGRCRAVIALATGLCTPHTNGYAAEPPGGGAPPPAPEQSPAPAVVIERVDVVDSLRQSVTTLRQVVSQAELTRYGDSSIMDVLRRQPGVTVVGASGSGKAEVRMRGLGNGYVRILVNGEPTPPNFLLETLSPDLVERIEIMQAPSVSLGTQAIAGTINIVLKKAGLKRHPQLNVGISRSDGYWSPNLSGTYGQGTDDRSWLITGALRKLKGDERYHSDIAGEDSDGPLRRELEQCNRDNAWNWSLAPQANWTLAADNTLSWQGFINNHQYDSAGLDRMSYLAGPSSAWGYDRYTSDGRNSSVRNSLTWARQLSEHTSLELKAGLTLAESRTGSTIHFFDAQALQSHLQNVRDDSNSTGASLMPSLSYHLGEGHQLTAGADLKRDEQTQTRMNVLDGTSLLGTVGNHFDITQDRHAAYIQDEWTITPAWSADLGLRWDQFAIISTSDLGPSFRYRRDIVSPVLQSVWKMPGTSKDRVKLAVSRTWRAPSMESLSAGRSYARDNTLSTPDTVGNPQLKPELAWGSDLSYEHGLPGNGQLNTTLFLRQIDDVIVTYRTQELGRWVARPLNVGQAHSVGIEVEAKLKLSQLVDGAPGVSLRGNLARYWSSVDAIPGPGNRLGSQTPLSVTLGADYTLSSLPVTLGTSFSYVKQDGVSVSAYESTDANDQRRLDIYGLWKISPTALLRVTGANLLKDEEHKESHFVAPAQWQSKSTTLSTHRTIRAVLEMKL